MARYDGYYLSLTVAFAGHLGDVERLIWLDVERTSPFLSAEQKTMLHRILFAFVKRNMEVSYCQGMNFIAHFFLVQGFTEEEIFWILCFVLEQSVSLSYFINLLPVYVDVELMVDMMRHLHPDFMTHIAAASLDLNFILVPLLVTLLSNIKNRQVA